MEGTVRSAMGSAMWIRGTAPEFKRRKSLPYGYPFRSQRAQGKHLGEMTGVIRYQSSEILGTIEKNTSSGIFGRITENRGLFCQGELVETAYKQAVETGPAVLLSAVGGMVKAYSIQIEKVNLAGSDPNKSMVISVSDPELLAITGGIIQGMSGSPILQNGKLIGALTHVFVNDPTKGYGIFIENMIGVES